jgi:hypothetical protein
LFKLVKKEGQPVDADTDELNRILSVMSSRGVLKPKIVHEVEEGDDDESYQPKGAKKKKKKKKEDWDEEGGETVQLEEDE